MVNKIIKCLSIILLIMVVGVGYKIVNNIYSKSKIKEANTVFNESNEIYINRNGETGVIEYK